MRKKRPKSHKLHSVKPRPRGGRRVLSSTYAARVVAAPIGHDADRTTAATRADEAAALGDRREGRSMFDAGRREGHESRVKARGVRARHAEGACAHRFQARDRRRRHAARLPYVKSDSPDRGHAFGLHYHFARGRAAGAHTGGERQAGRSAAALRGWRRDLRLSARAPCSGCRSMRCAHSLGLPCRKSGARGQARFGFRGRKTASAAS